MGESRSNLWPSLNVLTKFKTCIPSTITYKVHRRSVNQLQRDKNGHPLSGDKPMLAGDCTIFNKDLDYPEDCITEKQRKAFKRKAKKK